MNMRIVDLIDGAFEVRWMWLPFWLATNPKLRVALEGELKTIVALNALTDTAADLDALHNHVVRRIEELHPGMRGLQQFLDGMRSIELS